jgi:hypothetical protein
MALFVSTIPLKLIKSPGILMMASPTSKGMVKFALNYLFLWHIAYHLVQQ